MVDTIVALTRETAAETGRASLDSRVLTAMNKVPRHRFVPADQEPNAYANRPLPIGNGQTISQPFIVALMTDMLGLKATD
ncbi:MAG TPA: protein-L-isoaspartate O-methyltransferase, partial [Burkholderiales bacterium]|nr:protein-L-isoaspartate O-methyltransferase [Burkholderiales bacterium]